MCQFIEFVQLHTSTIMTIAVSFLALFAILGVFRKPKQPKQSGLSQVQNRKPWVQPVGIRVGEDETRNLFSTNKAPFSDLDRFEKLLTTIPPDMPATLFKGKLRNIPPRTLEVARVITNRLQFNTIYSLESFTALAVEGLDAARWTEKTLQWYIHRAVAYLCRVGLIAIIDGRTMPTQARRYVVINHDTTASKVKIFTISALLQATLKKGVVYSSDSILLALKTLSDIPGLVCFYEKALNHLVDEKFIKLDLNGIDLLNKVDPTQYNCNVRVIREE